MKGFNRYDELDVNFSMTTAEYEEDGRSIFMSDCDVPKCGNRTSMSFVVGIHQYHICDSHVEE